MNDFKKNLENYIFQHGFDVVGYSSPSVDKKAKEEYLSFLNKNYHGEMKWLERHFETKINPKRIWNNVKSIIVIGQNYAPKKNPLINNLSFNKANISVYAQNEDYHEVIKIKLKKIQSWLLNKYYLDSKIFVDSSPIFEKYFAKKANLGWQGKHTNIVSKEYGSWLFLAEIFLPVEIKSPKSKIIDGCGSCAKCIEVCPTKALVDENKIDARKCISYLTIENKGPIPMSLRKKIGNKVYGCDDCLSICPWNKFAKKHNEMKFEIIKKLELPSLKKMISFDEYDYRTYFSGTPLRRLGYIRFLRNVLIAIGNTEKKCFSRHVIKKLDFEDEIVKSIAVWSLYNINKKAFRIEKQKRYFKEKSSLVKKEWDRF